MPVLVDRIGQTEVNCLIWIGRVSKAEALAMPGRIDPSRPEFGCRWISYFNRGADLSDLDAACLLELRERLRPVVAGLAAKGEFRMTLASNSKFNDPLLAVWRVIAATDPDYLSNPLIVHDIESASRALGLLAVEADHARVWIESRIAGISPDS
ncbi:hypothetical protein [Phenylobacterium sp.]|jgi:hypothetical protein|uniref:hypothetical protein n=1 Tax=Phenylobacterium sp. TaxID=1871053 RepID=UPI002F414BC8